MDVYLDNNATTPLHKSVKEVITETLSYYANPSASYADGLKVKLMIKEARSHCAALINTSPESIIFTSGGSESNNTVLNSKFLLHLSKKNKERNEIIVSAIEHPSVMKCAGWLKKNGFTVHFAPVDRQGKIVFEEFRSLLSERTALVSFMSANNELGTIQKIRILAETAHKYGALIHTDAVQAAGKIPVDVKDWDVDYLSFSGHKFYGPKGAGVLFVKENAPFIPLIYGGKQEEGKRSGTENVCGIIGMGKASELALNHLNEWNRKYISLKNRLITGLKNSISEVQINGDTENCLAQTISISFPGTEAEVVQLYLENQGIKVSTGSACCSGSPSKVLKAIGMDTKTANSTLRFSLGIYNTEEQIDYTIGVLKNIIPKLIST